MELKFGKEKFELKWQYFLIFILAGILKEIASFILAPILSFLVLGDTFMLAVNGFGFFSVNMLNILMRITNLFSFIFTFLFIFFIMRIAKRRGYWNIKLVRDMAVVALLLQFIGFILSLVVITTQKSMYLPINPLLSWAFYSLLSMALNATIIYLLLWFAYSWKKIKPKLEIILKYFTFAVFLPIIIFGALDVMQKTSNVNIGVAPIINFNAPAGIWILNLITYIGDAAILGISILAYGMLERSKYKIWGWPLAIMILIQINHFLLGTISTTSSLPETLWPILIITLMCLWIKKKK